MLKHYMLVLLVGGSLFLASEAVLGQDSEEIRVNAKVEPDSGKGSIQVFDLKLDFEFAGYGVYIPAEYPTLTVIPLETGERVRLDKIAKATFKGTRVFWKKWIEPSERKKYDNVDSDGYYHWSDIEVAVTILDWNGQKTKSRIKRPEFSDVYLVGRTPRGDFKLQLDQENGKTVVVVFEPNFIMMCPNDKTHVFPNADYIYCPKCGAKLEKVIPKPEP